MSDKININTLKDNLSLVIQNEISNMRLLQDINKEFVAKGLNLDIPMLLFDKGLTVHEIKDENVLIALEDLMKTTCGFIKPVTKAKSTIGSNYFKIVTGSRYNPRKINFNNDIRIEVKTIIGEVR